MKIKQVCEATGLTDRAIRYYIEEGLAAPAYTENYMGRRAYDFTGEDVAALNHVATLRKFGFTVEEIRRILGDPQESIAIVGDVRARKEETVRQEGENLDALSRLEAEKAYTVAELALALAEPVQAAEMPREDWLEAGRRWTIRLVRRALLCVLAMLPVIMLLRGGDCWLTCLPLSGDQGTAAAADDGDRSASNDDDWSVVRAEASQTAWLPLVGDEGCVSVVCAVLAGQPGGFALACR